MHRIIFLLCHTDFPQEKPHTHTHARARARARTHKRTHARAHAHTNAHTLARAHIQTHAHAHKQTQNRYARLYARLTTIQLSLQTRVLLGNLPVNVLSETLPTVYRHERSIAITNCTHFTPVDSTLTLFNQNHTLTNYFLKIHFNPLNPELNTICYLLALLAHHFLHVSRIRVKSLTLRLLMSYIYGAPILDVSISHTTMHHSR